MDSAKRDARIKQLEKEIGAYRERGWGIAHLDVKPLSLELRALEQEAYDEQEAARAAAMTPADIVDAAQRLKGW